MPLQRPADFAVAYSWQAGALPPPYHYEYSITINADGQSELLMLPGYAADEMLQWREPFQVEAADLDRLYQHFRERGLFTQTWQEALELRVGGSSESMKVVASGDEVEIPSQLVARQESTAAELYTAVKALVPPEIWSKLEVQLQQYQESYQP